MSFWDERYQGEAYLFGEAPNAFLAAQAHRLRPGMSALAVADGEGRNGVWLAEARGTTLRLEEADLASWAWPEGQFDVVAAIFIQFAGPDLRDQIFAGLKRALKPGGLLLLEGYRPEQIAYGTGGPRVPENLYTEAMLRAAFSDFEILELSAYDAVIKEGAGHSGQSALIDLVARRPV